MAVTGHIIVDGPHPQRDGSLRGVIGFVTDDARVLPSRPIQAVDQAAWDALLPTLVVKAQAKAEVNDSEVDIDPTQPIEATGYANHQQRAVAQMKKAWLEPLAYDAYLLIDGFNTYRSNRGLSLAQVRTELALWGLPNEEFDEIIEAYGFLNANDRPADMQAYKPIQDNWEAR